MIAFIRDCIVLEIYNFGPWSYQEEKWGSFTTVANSQTSLPFSIPPVFYGLQSLPKVRRSGIVKYQYDSIGLIVESGYLDLIYYS